jgi:hypothetical protein
MTQFFIFSFRKNWKNYLQREKATEKAYQLVGEEYDCIFNPNTQLKKPHNVKTTPNIMRKYRVLQLGLQLGFPIGMDICNSWYLYSLECYWTSYSSCNEHLMLYTISYIRRNSHVTICNFFVTHLHVRFPHTFQCGKQNANVANSSICWQMTYVNTFYKLFTFSLMNIIFNYFFHPLDEWLLLLYFIIYL